MKPLTDQEIEKLKQEWEEVAKKPVTFDCQAKLAAAHSNMRLVFDWQAAQAKDFADVNFRAEMIVAEIREMPGLEEAVLDLLNQDNYIDEQENREREE